MASSSAATAAEGEADAPGEEGILVAIRMRPLNSRESSSNKSNNTNNRVWRVLQKYNSITQCTATGKPLPERIHNRTFFSYDKTFGESSTTRQVYEATSRGIVDSVANGLNGTIFAYGQTSSGKTFTMQGSGTLEDGALGSPRGSGSGGINENGGVVHMAAYDIFNHIEKEPERVFLVRVSFIEIYNEEVRDLLVSGDSNEDATLTVREDKRRGVFVNSNETIVTSMDSLLSVLFAGEKNRSVASTGMNERSSRSHTIFRITVESRLKETKKNGDDEDSDEEDEGDLLRGDDDSENKSAVRVSTLNLVDLAGSESVRHTGSTGDRQKEGGKINQSLLTLSRVIGSLGQNAAHVNFRDSKLTRILQPSLSGNARMAVICCATPSELYLEETRSTLQFASRAKLVKTRATVNEVMDDRSLIKKLQRELKEARKGGPGKDTMEQMKALEEKAASAECANQKAKEDLAKVKQLILKGGVLPGNVGASSDPSSLFVYNDNDETIQAGADKFSLGRPTKGKSKRRYSDGVVNDAENVDLQLAPFSSPAKGGTVAKLQAQTEMKPKKSKPTAHIQPSDMTDDVDIGLLKEALAAKSAQAASFKAKFKEAEDQNAAMAKKFKHEQGEKEMLRLSKQDLESQVTSLASDKEFALNEHDVVMTEKDSVISTSLGKIEKMLDERKEQASALSELQALMDSLQGQLATKEEDHSNTIKSINEQLTLQQEADTKVADIEGKLEAATHTNGQLTDQVMSLENANEDATKILTEKEAALEEAQSNLVSVTEEATATSTRMSKEIDELSNAKIEADERVAEVERSLEASTESNTQLTELVAALQTANGDATKLLAEKDKTLEEAQSTIDALREESSSSTSQLLDQTAELRNAKEKAEERVRTLENKLESDQQEAASKLAEVEGKIEAVTSTNAQLLEEVASLNAANEGSQATIDSLKENASSAATQVSEEAAELRSAKEAAEERVATLENDLSDKQIDLEQADQAKKQLTEQVESLKTALDGKESEIATVKKGTEATSQLSDEVTELRNANGVFEARVATLEGDLEAGQLALQEMERQAETSEDDIVRLAKENNTSTLSIQDLQSELADLNTAHEDQAVALQTSLDEKSSVSNELSSLQVKYDSIQSTSAKTGEELESVVLQKDQEINVLNETITSSNTRMAELEREVSTLSSERYDLSKKLETNSAELSSVQDELSGYSKMDELQAKITDLGAVRDTAKEKVKELVSEMESDKKTIEVLQVERDDLVLKLGESKAQLGAAESERDEFLNEAELAVTGKEKMMVEIEATETKHGETLDQLTQEVDAFKSKVLDMTAEAESQTANISELESSIESANERISEVLSGKDASDVLSSLKTEKDEIASKLDKANANVARLEKKKNDEVAKLSAEISSVQSKFSDIVANLEAQVTQKSEETQLLNEVVTSSNEEIAQLKEQVSSLAQERDGLTTKIEEATTQLSSMKSFAADNTETPVLEAKVKEFVAQLDTERAEAQTMMIGLNKNISDLENTNTSLLADIEAYKPELNEILSQAEKTEAEKGEYLNQLQSATDVVAHLEKSLADKSEQINQLNDQLATLNNQVPKAESSGGDSEAVESLKKEVIELKGLLTSANASVGEARSAAMSADQELEQKELQLEDAFRHLAEQEEARRIAEDKVRLAELSPRNSPARADSEEELLRDMEVLMGEKIDAESRLEQELNRRKEVVDGINKRAEEEKQLLMEEAEDKMVSLRDEILQLKSDLSRVESDCYNMKDENADLQDKLNRVEAKAADSDSVVTSMSDELSKEQNARKELQEKLDQLEQESASFKAQVFAAKASFEAEAQAKLSELEDQLDDALSQLDKSRNEVELSHETINELNNDIEQYRNELDSVKGAASNENGIALSRLREELAQTKLDLSHAEADCLTAKREFESAKEKVDRVKKHEHEKQQKFASKAKEAIETLKERLAKAEVAQKASAANGSEVEVEKLEGEVKKLKSTLRDKDERIKKLEKSKITKSQIANIQKLKDERTQFMAEAKEYKHRVEELESQKPKRAGLRDRNDSSPDQSKEVEKLEDDLKQCENKLRKYVNHCQTLESDRKGIMEAISSCDVGDVVGDSIAEIVASLCDRLASVEEECDALASSEGKAAEYLAELDSLREKYSEVEHQVQSYEKKDSNMAIALAECKANLKKAQEKIAALVKDKESLEAIAKSAKGNISELQSERRRQMQYLENENLQLGEELNKTKKQLTEAKGELDAVQKDAFSGEQTEELQGLSNLLASTSTKRTTVESSSKAQLPSGSKRIPLGSSRKRCPESPAPKEGNKDKENLLNKKQRTLSSTIASPFGSAKKKRSANPFSSVKKAARRTRKALSDDSPTKQYALGDSEPTADVTSECNQS